MSELSSSYEWVYKIIVSCNNDFHMDCADVLIELFNAKYEDEDLVMRLREARQEKHLSLHTILA